MVAPLIEDESGGTLVDRLLDEQAQLTAVERFSQHHEKAKAPAQEQYYKSLIPLSKPAEGEQFAFHVDLDACSGCKACVTACHSLNGLDEGESWRDIGLLYGEPDPGEPVQHTVTTACHHCSEPGCADGCPVLAYDKDPETGIVRHLDDQCIGCRYCEMKCPYGVPKYSDARGIVRKCDMCHDRLAEGEAPACVQACPNEAIKIQIVPVGKIEGDRMLPGAFDSNYTRPTTTYVSENPLDPELISGDRYDLSPAHAHTPLVWMLVWVQLAFGLLLADGIGAFVAPIGYGGETLLRTIVAGAAVVAVHLGLLGSTLHLGRPLYAWRAFLGWRKSWLSREIIAFSAFAPAVIAYAAARAIPVVPEPLRALVLGGALITGVAGIFASVMVYADTQRPFWALYKTALRFFGTPLLFAGALLTAFGVPLGMLFVALGLAAKLVVELPSLFAANNTEWSTAKKSGLLQLETLKPLTKARFAFAGLGLISLFVFPPIAPLFLALGEFAARAIFFRAVDEPKMPGGLTS